MGFSFLDFFEFLRKNFIALDLIRKLNRILNFEDVVLVNPKVVFLETGVGFGAAFGKNFLE